MERIRGDFLEMLGQPVQVTWRTRGLAPVDFKSLLAALDIGVFVFDFQSRISFIPWREIRALSSVEPWPDDIPGAGSDAFSG